MIIVEKVRAKNFMSYGDAWTEIDVLKTATSLIIGKNGAGKSSIIVEATTFAFFGKPFRDINKPQLINTVNDRDCKVEVEFVTNTHRYRVVRGMKPAVFEIYQDGQLINQESKTRDYQKVLEQQILKINYHSFRQIICLGSATFKPFMQLVPGVRRVVIEDLLGLSIFGVMNQELKFKIAHTKEKLKALDVELKLIDTKISSHVNFIDSIEKNKVEEKTKLEKEIARLNEEFKLLEKSNRNSKKNSAEVKRKYDDAVESLKSAESTYSRAMAEATSEKSSIEKKISFYEKNHVCPTCSQDIEEGFAHSHVSDFKQKLSEIDAKIEDLKSQSQSYLPKLRAEVKEALENLNAAEEKLSKLRADGMSNQKQINYLQTKLLSQHENKGNVEKFKEELEKMRADRLELDQRYRKSQVRMKYFEEAEKLLNDQGIKSQIIKTYIPLINSLINKYLKEMEFFVSFHLDENFNETIKSRYRDTFSYNSFSEGEKRKIDLALLFTWREISRMKNSTSMNMLVMDETMDGSLDEESVKYFLRLVQSMEKNTNIFVISHNDKVRDSFERMIIASKDGNFSQLTEA